MILLTLGTLAATLAPHDMQAVVPLIPVQAAPAPQPQTEPERPRFPGPPLVPSPQYADTAPAAPLTAATDGMLTVTGDRVNLRAGPGTEYETVGALTRGTPVTPAGPTTGAWVEVRDAAGRQGFISARFLSPAD